MAGWNWKDEMSNNAVLAIAAGMIPFVALTETELERLYTLTDDEYDARTAPHHVLIDDKTMYVAFVEAEAVGRQPMTVEQVAAHLTLTWDERNLSYKAAWSG